MTVHEALGRITRIDAPAAAPPAARSAADTIAACTGAAVALVDETAPGGAPGVLRVLAPLQTTQHGRLAAPRIDLRLRPDGSGHLSSAGGRFLYAAACHLVEVTAQGALGPIEHGVSIRPSFAWNRSCYDIFLAQ